MSMVIGLTALSDNNIQKVLADPPLIWKVIAPDDPEFYEAERNMKKSSGGFFSRLFTKKKDPTGHPDPPAGLQLTENEGVEMDLDKAWHGIHFLLTGSAWEGKAPLDFLLKGGETVGEIDVGYGPARCFTAHLVGETEKALAEISVADFQARFSREEMMANEIYPEIWDQEGGDNLDYLVDYFKELKIFITQTAQSELGLVVSMG